jgi:hypothetical protein
MTTFDAVNTVYGLLKNQGLPVFKFEKPGGDEKEYIVINSLPITGGILKKCYVNVNIHVKDISFPDSTTAPDSLRLEQLAGTYSKLLEKNIEGNVHLYFDKQGIEQEEALKEHYVNIRLLCNLIES